jgi:hypothetical protein
MTAQPEGVDIAPLPESDAAPTQSPSSAACAELGLDAPRSENEAQLAALVDLAEFVLSAPAAWRAFAEGLDFTIASLRLEIAGALLARFDPPPPLRRKFRKRANRNRFRQTRSCCRGFDRFTLSLVRECFCRP